MPKSKIAISLEEATLRRVDRLVKNHVFPSRSKAIEEALTDKLERLERRRLASQCALLDPEEEQALAEEGLRGASWPEY